MNLLGIEIGGTKLQLVRGDENGRIQSRRRLTVAREAGAEGIRQQIARTLPDLISDGSIAATGVGFGGPVDWATGKICCSHHIAGWSEFDLGGWLRSQIGTPVFVDNDANVAALGESACGAGMDFNPVFYVTLGSGVGGGLVCDGRIYHGATPGESEIGHVRLDRTGTTVESRCSGWSVDARIRQLKATEPGSVLSSLVGDERGGEARHLSVAWQQNDPAAHRILSELAQDLAFGLSHAVHLFHPQVIIIGGGLAAVGAPLRTGVATALRRFTMEAFAPGPEVRLAALGEDTVPVGALWLARTGLNL